MILITSRIVSFLYSGLLPDCQLTIRHELGKGRHTLTRDTVIDNIEQKRIANFLYPTFDSPTSRLLHVNSELYLGVLSAR